jgi:DNA-damage-inducible protein D
MKTDLIHSLTATFEQHAQRTEGGAEYWLARELQHLLGYAEWRNFQAGAVSKASTACDVSGHPVADHFVDVNKLVDLGSGSQQSLPAAEDVKKVERRLASDEEKSLKNPEGLGQDEPS